MSYSCSFAKPKFSDIPTWRNPLFTLSTLSRTPSTHFKLNLSLISVLQSPYRSWFASQLLLGSANISNFLCFKNFPFNIWVTGELYQPNIITISSFFDNISSCINPVIWNINNSVMICFQIPFAVNLSVLWGYFYSFELLREKNRLPSELLWCSV